MLWLLRRLKLLPSVGAYEGKQMRSRIEFALTIAAGVVIIVTLAWTISEVGKNNRTIRNLSERARVAEAERKQEIAVGFDALNARIDRLRSATVGHDHSDMREFVIAGHLARAENPIVFLGDSITESAVLPNAICGHAVVNAGIGGAGVDYLLKVEASLLAGKSLALVVVAVGTNDARGAPGRESQFSASYVKLLQSLALIAPKLVVANIPSVDPKGVITVAVGIDASLISRINLLLPRLAEDAGASFIDLNKAVSSEGATETLDGVHLAPRAYALWDSAMLAGVKSALNCSASVN
jgi:lysophospholipase L1-like esterase